jgi:hypothetical protein
MSENFDLLSHLRGTLPSRKSAAGMIYPKVVSSYLGETGASLEILQRFVGQFGYTAELVEDGSIYLERYDAFGENHANT